MNNSYGSIESGTGTGNMDGGPKQPLVAKPKKKSHRQPKNCINKNVIVMGLVIILTIVIIGAGVGIANREPLLQEDTLLQSTTKFTSKPHPKKVTLTPVIRQDKAATLGVYEKAAVATDGKVCAPVGVDVLRRNGSAVDAAIATLFCNGLFSAQSMGIGGGFIMNIYTKSDGQVNTLIARESAPAAATEDMFHGDPSLSASGPLAMAVPGEIRGYYEAKKRFGNPNVTWMSLIQPSIDMARNGIKVSWSQLKYLKMQKDKILADPGMREIFINPLTNDTWQEGDVYKRENLAKTLERIGMKGADEFYEGTTAKNLVKDIQRMGGIITSKDLKSYKALWKSSVTAEMGEDLELHSTPLPSSGIILAYIMNLMRQYNVKPEDDNPLLYHRLNEAFKWAYAYRSKLGDPADPEHTEDINKLVNQMMHYNTTLRAFRKIDDNATSNDPSFYGGDFEMGSDAGTSHTCVLAPNGDAVSVTSTVNLPFGSVVMSPSTGVIFNSQMDDFSSPNITNFFGLPPSPTNFIKPGKRPLSSMSPSIVFDKSDKGVRLITGSAGGTKITTAVAQITLRNLWLNQPINEAIDAGRIHHQLLPMEVEAQSSVPKEVIAKLREVGNSIADYGTAGSIVQGIEVSPEGKVYASSDPNKAGGVDGF